MRLLLPLLLCFIACADYTAPAGAGESAVLPLDTAAIVQRAGSLLSRQIVTVTDFVAERSAGGLHDYYSEGRYWWPDPDNPGGPYIRRDGRSNPGNFRAHKDALADFSETVTTLTAAYRLTGEERYARRAIEHLLAWFTDPATRMNPSLLYGQAIQGITSGRGIGIIDTIRLIDVALSAELLRQAGVLEGEDLVGVQGWFSDYADWLTTHPYGDDERHNNNNHSTWWGAQVAAFARVAERPDLTAVAAEQFRSQLPIQFATDGSQPDELSRTKPFHYLNYNLRGWATFASLLSDEQTNYWTLPFTTSLPPYAATAGGAAGEKFSGEERTLTLRAAFDYALPYLEGAQSWPYPTELEPAIQPECNDYLVLAYRGLNDPRLLNLWKALPDAPGEPHANLVVWQNSKQYE